MKIKAAILPWLAMLAALSACGGDSMMANNSSADLVDTVPSNQVESVYCEAVEQRVSREDCEDLTRADAEVRPGAAAFNVPDPMRRGESVEVHLVIDRRSPRAIRIIEDRAMDDSVGLDSNMSADGLPANVSGGLADGNNVADTEEAPADAEPLADEPPPTPGQIVDRLAGTPERFHPPVGRHMRAELVGQGFEIRPRSEASQEIPLGGQASWLWEVTARRGGNQSLTLITVVEGVANGRRFVLARTPRVRTVVVEVSLRDRIWDVLVEAPNWIKAATAVIVAVGGFLTAWFGLPWQRRRKAARRRADPGKGDGTGPRAEA